MVRPVAALSLCQQVEATPVEPVINSAGQCWPIASNKLTQLLVALTACPHLLSPVPVNWHLCLIGRVQ